ncbi:MAG: prepilin-type N-terminal cleavage/methylation domain-containing protein [Pseudomonadota bacterium]
MKQKYINKSGFTLIELSIVMVIIGLIVGGVFVGQDLIRAAEIRSTISQIEKYDASVMTFFGKYGEIPGDISSQNATNYGFTARSGATAHGDGNRIITGCDASGVAFDTKFGCEVELVWHDLSDAGLIAGRFIGTDQCCDNNGALTAPHTMNDFVPAAKISRGVNINIWGVPSSTSEVGGIKRSSHYYQFYKDFTATGS